MIRFKPGKVFFNSKSVIRAMDNKARTVLSRFGAFVRRAAKSSIRKRKASAQPGQPPSSHTGLLRRLIWFGFDHHRRSVVIGPALLSGRGKGEAPSVLEYGGTERLVGRRRKTKVARYRARPFMSSALKKELPGLPAMWKNSVK